MPACGARRWQSGTRIGSEQKRENEKVRFYVQFSHSSDDQKHRNCKELFGPDLGLTIYS